MQKEKYSLNSKRVLLVTLQTATART